MEMLYSRLLVMKVEMGDLSGLGMPLAEFVRQHEINPLTNNLHEVLYQASLHLYHLSHPDEHDHISHSQPLLIENHTIQEQIERCLTTYPHLFQLLRILKEQLDMASLIRRPEEIYESEGSWVGRDYVPPNKVDDSGSDGKGGEVVNGQNAAPAVDSTSLKGSAFDSPEVLAHVMDYTARTIVEVDEKIRQGEFVKLEGQSGDIGQGEEEDPVIRKLRLNLLALAKRAPLDKIARLPKELVPVHIRHFVPTIGP
jgi:bromodomain-containing protein 7